jgi:hypothetical protein
MVRREGDLIMVEITPEFVKAYLESSEKSNWNIMDVHD